MLGLSFIYDHANGRAGDSRRSKCTERHIQMKPYDAVIFAASDGEYVRAKTDGEQSLVFNRFKLAKKNHAIVSGKAM